MSKIRIVLADDHPLMRDGTRNLLSQDTNLEVVGEAKDGAEALQLVESLQPDLLIFDISMPDVNGVELARQVSKRYPTLKMLVLTVHHDQVYARTMLKFGVKGFISKNASGRELIRAVQTVLDGRMAIMDSEPELDPLSHSIQPEASLNNLSTRELEVLQRLLNGERNNEIAEELVISPKTLETHIRNIYGKLDIQSRAELLINSQRWRIILTQFHKSHS